MFYFKTIEERSASGIPRLRALPGQELNGEPIDETANVQSNTRVRSNNLVGTIFESTKLEKLFTPGANLMYYRVEEDDLRVSDRKE